MHKYIANKALNIAKEICLGLKSTDNLIEINSLYSFYRWALRQAYIDDKLTQEEYILLVDILLILVGKKDTH